MLLPLREKPLVAAKEIVTFKVMVKWKGSYYVCPPAFQYFQKNNSLQAYQLNTLYHTDSNDPNQDYRKDGVIGSGFFHTFCDMDAAKEFARFLEWRIESIETKPYFMPWDAKIIVLEAIIPKGSLYYEGIYKRKTTVAKTYASNKVIYYDKKIDL